MRSERGFLLAAWPEPASARHNVATTTKRQRNLRIERSVRDFSTETDAPSMDFVARRPAGRGLSTGPWRAPAACWPDLESPACARSLNGISVRESSLLESEP